MHDLEVGRSKAHEDLDRLFDSVALTHENGVERESAILELSLFLSGLGEHLGSEYVSAIYGSDDLHSAADRMMLVSALLTGIFGDRRGEVDKFSPTSIRREFAAIAEGDAPFLFAKQKGRSGKRENSYRLALVEARAFYWDSFLKTLGASPADRQGEILFAFGKTWDAIRKNRPALDEYLGQDFVRGQIEKAAAVAEILQNHPTADTTIDKIRPWLRADGQAYKDELRRFS